MTNPEQLQPAALISHTAIPTPADGFEPLTPDLILAVIQDRRQRLENLKPKISRKLYYAIEEKLAAQQKQLQQILDWQEGRQTQARRYTLILDPHYFEQELFT